MTKRYFVGQTFGSGRVRVDKERIKTFAAEFDPQPFHLDCVSASKGDPTPSVYQLRDFPIRIPVSVGSRRRRWDPTIMLILVD